MLIGYLIAAILLALALTRLPAVIQRRNLVIASSAAAIVLAFALITPVIYDSLDRLSPVPNLVDLAAKLALFTGLLLAGTQVARAWDAPKTQRRISGLPGAAVFLAVFIAEVVIFATVHTTSQAPDLADNLSNGLVRVYSTLATAYPAYIAVLLLPHVRKGLASSQTSTRATSIFLLVGFTLAGIRFALGLVTLIAPPTYYVGQIVSGGAATFVALGLATAFFARAHRQRQVN
jgi:hypothetical protein